MPDDQESEIHRFTVQTLRTRSKKGTSHVQGQSD